MTKHELEELVYNVINDLRSYITECEETPRCSAPPQVVTILDNILKYPSDGDYKVDGSRRGW